MSPSLCLLRVGTGTWREAEFVSLEGRRPLPVGLDLALEDLGHAVLSVVFAIGVTADHIYPLLGPQGWGAENGLI